MCSQDTTSMITAWLILSTWIRVHCESMQQSIYAEKYKIMLFTSSILN
jgi:hypothetical protein